MIKGEHSLFASTEKVSLVVSTTACSYHGFVLWASAACTLTIEDSGGTNVFHGSTDAGGIIIHSPAFPASCTSGLAATNSGGGYYTIFYGKP